MLLAACLACGIPAWGAVSAYKVEIEAPPDITAVLGDNLDIARFKDQPDLSPTQFQRLFDLTAVQARDLLATEGYFSPEISTELSERDGASVARIKVIPGTASVVESVTIDFAGAISRDEFDFAARRNGVGDRWALRRGDRFRQAAWTDAKNDALRAVVEEWFPAAHIAESEARVDPDRSSVALKIVIDSGPPFTLGELEVTGLHAYPPESVANLNRIAPGTPYSMKRLTDLQAALLGSGYFSSAFATIDVNPERPDRVPIKVSVVEALPKSLRFGLGYSTDIGFNGEISFEYKDLFDRGWRLFTGALLAQREQYVGIGFALPERASGYRDSAGVSVRHTDIQGLVTSSFNLGLQHAKREEQAERELILEYIYEEKNVDQVAVTDRFKSTVLNYSWTQRNLDSFTYPRQGYLVNLQLGGAVEAILSDESFLRGYGRGALYIPVGDRDRLLFRGELGAIAAKNSTGIPLKYLFRTGGAQTVRGYEFESLGPRLANATVGGKNLAVASAEYDHMFTPEWGAAIFVDAGNAADTWSSFRFAMGYGAGLRWLSVVGPLGLDIAYGELDRKVRASFSVGFKF
jgi:translocation and assembly module TamA